MFSSLATPAQQREFFRFFAPTFLFCTALFCAPAFAQAVAHAGVDITPALDQIIAICAAALTIGAGFVARAAISWLASATHLKNTQAETALQQQVDFILQRAIGYAEGWAKMQVADPNSQLKNVQIDNFFIEAAVKYAVSSMPQLIERFGLTTDRLGNMIRSRLADMMGAPEADSGVIPHILAGQPVAPAAVAVQS